jgi:hypothetical protein
MKHRADHDRLLVWVPGSLQERDMIIGLAGRRIDARGAWPARFPVGNIPFVRARLRELLQGRKATLVVCSAACGADLLALDEAGRLGLRRRVVLPGSVQTFRAASVTDRPGDWGGLYDAIIADVTSRGELVLLPGSNGGYDAYIAVNRRILEEAVSLGRTAAEEVSAVLVWNGQPREGHDVTEAFGNVAREQGLSVIEISTL